MKYGGALPVTRILGSLLGRRLAERGRPAVDAIVPVPLHAARERKRGYNQAREIARFAAREIGCRCRSGWYGGSRETAEQTALPGGARRRNLRGAFAVEAAMCRRASRSWTTC